MKRSLWLGMVVVAAFISTSQAQTPTQLQTDELTLKNQRPPLPTDAAGLIEFFKAGSMKEGDKELLEGLVRKLSSDVFAIRDKAARDLCFRGAVALPFLKAGLANSSLEAKRRAQDCIRDIEATMKAETISAAARVLAARNDPKAAEVLFNYLPAVSNDPFLEEEILAVVGRLTIRSDKVDPLILNALKDSLTFRRNAAAYLIGRRAGPEHREQLRALLADADPAVRLRVMQGIYGKRPAQMLEEAVGGDESLLKSQKIEVTEEALLKYFRDKTLSDEKQKHFRALVKGMGSSSYIVREQATKQLVKVGTSVLSFLKEAEYDPNVELSRRARTCLDEIRSSSNTAIPIAAAHLLARKPQGKDHAPAEAIRTLLEYIPFADDDTVEEEVLTSLTLLCLREPKLEPEFVKALSDASTTRRSAAAYVLGHVGTKEDVARLPAMLDDQQALVRFRASQGLLASRNKAALPTFVKLIEQIPAPYLPRIEEVLFRIAEESSPNESIVATSAESRQKAAKAWAKWLDANQAKIDLTSLNDRESYLGLVTVCEYTNQFGNVMGQVWEGPRNGQKRWTITGVQGAMDAQSLPNGRVLIAENSANRVTERDTKGAIKWEFATPMNPVCCQRLPNGNTFIASYNMLMEVTQDKQVLYRVTPGNQYYFFSAYKARNGNIVAINGRNQGEIIEMDKEGRRINGVPVQNLGNWCSVEMQPNGNYLVALQSTGMVREIDRKGNEVWSKPYQGAFRATKLPNGHVLVASLNTRKVAEMDRNGAIVWETMCQGQPWGIHYR